MASSRTVRRRREARLAFDALSIEGGLLSPDWLARIALLEAGSQTPADYGAPKGLQLRDEIGRYWRIAQAHWEEFRAGRERKADRKGLAERFVPALLSEAFGFRLSTTDGLTAGERTYAIGLTALSGTVPVVVAPADLGLDALHADFGENGRRRSPFGLAQEYLNAADGALWGVVSNGVSLRLLRDNASLTRPAWIEADLERMFTEERFADFAALWLLAHESRFGRDGSLAAECVLETWRKSGREEGTRAREQLRRGVEQAILSLGNGFLSHPENQALRDALHDGSLTTDAYFQQLLRLVYRFIFLLTVEERGLLHPEGTSAQVKALYAEGYGLKRLRDRAAKRSAHDRFGDLWEATKIVFRGTAHGEPRLGLPALAGLFAAEQCTALEASKLENRALSGAMFHLAWLREQSGLSRVNWRDMGPEELGSVYESLLELVPVVKLTERTFSFATGDETKGNARKTTGSYYTPESLVQVLIDSALEPVVQATLAGHPDEKEAVEALLSLSVVDPACGSGHFLLAAARRLASHVARLQAGGTPSAPQYRHALREVVGRCIFGVDLNPLAVELCKVALWMEALDPGKPLSFLDSHIQQGNGLLGATPELMARGIPDNAWVALEGDDKRTASALKKRNKAEASGQRGLNLGPKPVDTQAMVQAALAALDEASDDDTASLRRKHEEWARIQASEAYRQEKLTADAWCAAFVWPKPTSNAQTLPIIEAAPTNEVWRQLKDGTARPLTLELTGKIAARYSFFHWHVAFAPVFRKGGFDVVLGNPPWERVKLQEQEFFASRHPEIATAPTAAARKKLISKLEHDDPRLFAEFLAARREAEGISSFLRVSGAYPLTGVGDINTYPVFAERDRGLLAGRGRLGVIMPTGIATDATTAPFFRDLVEKGALVSLYDFENRKPLFPAVDSRFKFCLLTLAGREHRIAAADFAFFAHDTSDLAKEGVRFSLSPEEIKLLNPNTGTCPVFRSRRDAEITLGIYRRVPVLINENDEANGNPWGIKFMRMFDMSNDSHLFHTREELEEDGWTLRGNVFERDVTIENNTAFSPPPPDKNRANTKG